MQVVAWDGTSDMQPNRIFNGIEKGHPWKER